MRIILFRHGPAEARDPARWPDDSVRPLTARGVDRTRTAARGVVRLEPGITRVFTSAALRALDTARLLSALLERDEPELMEPLAPEGSWKAVLQQLTRQPADAVVVLVGHEPGLGLLASALLRSSGDGALMLKKAGACSIACVAPEPGRGRLRWWLRPAALKAVSPIKKKKKGRVA